MEEVQLCLQELEDSIDLQKQVENALGNFAWLTDLGLLETNKVYY